MILAWELKTDMTTESISDVVEQAVEDRDEERAGGRSFTAG
jgi:hypothetical protein